MASAAPTSLHVVSSRLEPERIGALASCPEVQRAASLRELRAVLERVPDACPRTLDVHGHTTRGTCLLRLGDAVIDMLDGRVGSFFDELARDGVHRRAGIQRIRLVGCGTAATASGQLTLRLLARVLGVEVFGTTKPIQHRHYDARGLDPAFEHLLVASSRVPRRRPLAA